MLNPHCCQSLIKKTFHLKIIIIKKTKKYNVYELPTAQTHKPISWLKNAAKRSPSWSCLFKHGTQILSSQIIHREQSNIGFFSWLIEVHF